MWTRFGYGIQLYPSNIDTESIGEIFGVGGTKQSLYAHAERIVEQELFNGVDG